MISLPAHGEIVDVDRSLLLPADSHFNPAIALRDGALWMVYRRVSSDPAASVVDWPRHLAACRLGADLQPLADSNVDLSALIVDPPGARRWHADPRLFVRPHGLWMTYHDNTNLYALPLPLGKLPARLHPRPLILADRRRRERERNWGMFDDGVLKAVYTIDPHIVLRVSEDLDRLESRVLHETEAAIPWPTPRLGEPHGGSPPVRVGDCWFSFFQSSATIADGSKQKVYSVGFYGFEAEPPHSIKYMAPEAIVSGTDFDPPHSFFLNYAVAYPSGALYLDGKWLVALGVHDRTLVFAGFDHDRLLGACTRPAPPRSMTAQG